MLEWGWSKEQRNLSYGALRATLDALRDRLTVTEAAHFGAQLPTLVRGIYYDGWDPSRVPVKMDSGEFLARVRSELPPQIGDGLEDLVRTTLETLKVHVSEGEWQNIKSILPKDLKLIP